LHIIIKRQRELVDDGSTVQFEEPSGTLAGCVLGRTQGCRGDNPRAHELKLFAELSVELASAVAED
jgi:hypothetical protein